MFTQFITSPVARQNLPFGLNRQNLPFGDTWPADPGRSGNGRTSPALRERCQVRSNAIRGGGPSCDPIRHHGQPGRGSPRRPVRLLARPGRGLQEGPEPRLRRGGGLFPRRPRRSTRPGSGCCSTTTDWPWRPSARAPAGSSGSSRSLRPTSRAAPGPATSSARSSTSPGRSGPRRSSGRCKGGAAKAWNTPPPWATWPTPSKSSASTPSNMTSR